MCGKVARRATLAIFLGLALASCALPQESAAPKAETGQGDPLIWWKWANFLILAGGLGYLIRKNVPPLFEKQSSEIQSALREAAKVKADAAAYAAGIDARVANLQSEVEKLRVSARADMAAESERIRRETEHHVQRIREQTAQEIELMTRSATAGLRKYAAELAMGLAEQRIRSRMNPEVQQSLAEGFLHDLRERTPGSAN
ncbi:MAG TPA: ATP synthase F0 subunit B [Bryobacteraceae bacterium]|nr:ATP synthase F0 subunit B [Bryobacteraceae bacterium]